ncbi:MAG: DUF411 domain-containing protein [Dehalococcoidales bacterium]
MNEGFQVTVVYIEDDNSTREMYTVPPGMESCHITVLDDYYLEGHIPVEAIEKLLEENPDIDGLVMPGMPSGSHGMPGPQTEDFVIYAIKDGQSSEFMTIRK